jgi:peptide/nickel transport system ATP-binding protein
VSHDLRIVRHLSSRVAVMNAGKIVEFRDTKALFTEPRDTYTRQLISSVPKRRYKSRTVSSRSDST